VFKLYIQFLFGFDCVTPAGAEELGGSLLKKFAYESFLALDPVDAMSRHLESKNRCV